MKLDPAALRARAMGRAVGTNGAGANRTMPTEPGALYRDDDPGMYPDRPWAGHLERDLAVVDELKRSVGYIEPEGTGRWGTKQRHLVAATMAEARGVEAPGAIGRECGNCAFFRTEIRDFQQRTAGGCGKINAVVFGYGSCILGRPFGAPPAAVAKPAAPAVPAAAAPHGRPLARSVPAALGTNPEMAGEHGVDNSDPNVLDPDAMADGTEGDDGQIYLPAGVNDEQLLRDRQRVAVPGDPNRVKHVDYDEGLTQDGFQTRQRQLPRVQ